MATQFARAGLRPLAPATGFVHEVRIERKLHTDYHEPSDEISGIDFAHMTRAIQSLIEPIRWLADSPFSPEWKPGMRP